MNVSFIIVLISAVLPAFLLAGYIFFRDREHPEPPRLLVRGFFYGILSALLALAIDHVLELFLYFPSEVTNGLDAAWTAFGLAALPEESAKLLMLWFLLRRNPEFDEHLDGVVYASCVGLGFATFENALYLFNAGEAWVMTAVMRGLLSVPGHFFFAVLMGYYYSLVHFGYHRLQNRFLVLAAPVLAHGIYDAIAMSADTTESLQMVFFIALLLFCNELRKLCQRHINDLVEADRLHRY